MEPSGQLTLANISGEIVVTGVDGDDLTIRATKRVAGRGSAAADALDRVEIDIEERGNRVIVETDYPRHRRSFLRSLGNLRESEGRGAYPLDGDDRNADAFGLGGPQNASLLWYSHRVVRRHEAGAMLAWTARQRPEYTLNVLAGVSYWNSHVSDCLAREGPIEQVIPTPEEYSYDPDRIVYAWRRTEGDRARCRKRRGGSIWGSTGIWPSAGFTLDVPLGERAYFRVGYAVSGDSRARGEVLNRRVGGGRELISLGRTVGTAGTPRRGE